MAAPKKALIIGRALKTAARLPARVSGGRGSGRGNMSPIVDELPLVLLRVQIQGCTNLLAKDKNGSSDPFVVVSFAGNRNQTPVYKKNLNPTYASKDATFDFPIYLSLAEKLGMLEIVVWDKDMLRKEYLGETSLSLENWFQGRDSFSFDHQKNTAFSVNLVSSRASTHATGSVQVKIGFVTPPTHDHVMTFEEIYNELLRRSQRADISLLSAPPTEGIGTIRTQNAIPGYEDDGLSSDEGEPNWDEEDEEREYPASPAPMGQDGFFDQVISVEPPPPPPSPPTPLPEPPATLAPPPKTPKSAKFPNVFRRPIMTPQTSYDSTSGTHSNESKSALRTSSTDTSGKKKKFKKAWGTKKSDYNLNAENDILGIVILDIQGAQDLPKFKNMTRTGFDMDPFVVVSFGKKVFRTRVIRHSLNPVWEEKVLFHVRRYESAFKVQLTVLDWDKLSSNDHVGDARFDLSELMQHAPQRDEKTGLYPAIQDAGSGDMREFKLNLTTAKEMPWESKHQPVLTVRAKYQPYDALRQRFWRQYLKQYDTDDTGFLFRLELTSMLDSLGSTLSNETIDSFFTRHGKSPKHDKLTMDEAIQCLEAEVCRPTSEKKRLEDDDGGPDTSTSPTPMLMSHVNEADGTLASGQSTPGLALEGLNFSGAPVHPSAVQAGPPAGSDAENVHVAHPTEPSQQTLLDATSNMINAATTRVPATYAPPMSHRGPSGRQASTSSSEGDESSGTNSEDAFERVINIKNCPLCHRPRLNSKAEMDIVTHLAVCANQDPTRVDRIVVGNFVTASQAQRKWYTKVISKVSSGNYKIGANSANIIVQNRMTGQLEEEKMQVYVRLGIRLLYKGATSRMEGARARRLLKSLSIKQGIKYDSPESAREIPAFIEFHRLDMSEIQEPLNSFKTFNQFFYRKLKESARPVEHPDDHGRLVSAADCRMMAFETVTEATQLWIKGREFTVARLLGDAYRDQWDKYLGGALAIFRLAPQDYHRFHSPVDGTIGPMTYISGEYYTVNPQAIRTALDVYGENARKIVPIDSPSFGRVMAVCVGAMMVGSIKTTLEEGAAVKRGQEFGYFAFGGSTIVLLFEKGVVEWDEDLLINGRASLETLVRVGMGIGRSIKGRRTPKVKLSPSPAPLATHSLPTV